LQHKKLAKTIEQQKAAVFLSSGDSSYMNGQSVSVDCGLTQHL
jgi:NAD(P)-dependent dehydrogenase (short-subunit alcohol dehydrogenase family)